MEVGGVEESRREEWWLDNIVRTDKKHVIILMRTEYIVAVCFAPAMYALDIDIADGISVSHRRLLSPERQG